MVSYINWDLRGRHTAERRQYKVVEPRGVRDTFLPFVLNLRNVSLLCSKDTFLFRVGNIARESQDLHGGLTITDNYKFLGRQSHVLAGKVTFVILLG